MRKLAWFSLGFSVACGFAAYYAWRFVLPFCAAAWLLCGIVFFFSVKWRKLIVPVTVLLGCAVGLSWFLVLQENDWKPLSDLDGQTVEAAFTAGDYSESSLYGGSVDGTFQWKGRTYRARIYLKENLSVEPGQIIEGSFRFRLTTPEGLKESTYYQGNGILVIANQRGDIRIQEGQSGTWRYLPSRMAKHVHKILELCIPEDVRPFAQSLLLGDSSELSYQDETALRVSGIRHIIAVSGLHVAVLYGLIVKLTGNRRYLTFLIGTPALFVFAAMVGFTPSVCRASIMLCLMMLAGITEREYDSVSELAFAVLVLLVVNPFTAVSVSFQLSVTSVLGILFFQPSVYGRLEKSFGKAKGKGFRAALKRWGYGSVSVTVSAMSLSTPLSAYYFGLVSLAGILTNLLVLWMVAGVFYGIVAVSALGSLWLSGGRILGSIIAWGLRAILLIAGCVSKIPFAAVYTCSKPIVLWIALCYGLFLFYLLFRKGKPGWYLSIGLFSLCLAIMTSVVIPRMDSFRLTVLDVGEGQSILIQSKGESFLIDCGGYSDTGAADAASEMLLSQGVFSLDGIALTHFDSDHIGGIPGLLSRVKTEFIVLPEMGDTDVAKNLWSLTKGEIRTIENGEQVSLGDGTLTFYSENTGKTDNENSMGILFETQNCAILITGDRSRAGEKRLLQENHIPQVDILIAGHHGSKYSTSQELLEALQPNTVVISVGRGNSYGHPSAELLERLNSFDCKILRTDLEGTIVIRR